MAPTLSPWPRALRLSQWVKNLLVFSAAFFSGTALEAAPLMASTWVFLSFCLLSSSVYLVNDILDLPRDRLHPEKRFRPLAAREIKPAHAALAALALALSAFLLLFALPDHRALVAALLALYLALNIAYSLSLKRLPVVDVHIIASGFLLRVFAGAAALGIMPTTWLLLCVYFLSLLIGFGKRRAELAHAHIQSRDPHLPHSSRAVLKAYDVESLDAYCIASATLAIASYALYCTIAKEDVALLLSIPPTVIGVFRYLHIVRAGTCQAEQPERLLYRDRTLAAALLAWALVLFARLYLLPS